MSDCDSSSTVSNTGVGKFLWTGGIQIRYEFQQRLLFGQLPGEQLDEIKTSLKEEILTLTDLAKILA